MPKEKDNNIKDRIIQIVLIVIIILLLIHNCSLMKEKDNGIIDGESHNIIDITCDSKKCEKPEIDTVDCLIDSDNKVCLVPDFKGQTKKELLDWLNSIENTIEIEIKLVENPNYKDGTIISQSIVGTSIKDLLEHKKKLVITIVNNGSLVDCSTDSTNSVCSLPNFVGKKTSSVYNWNDKIANQINIKYVYVESDKPSGTITSQSIKAGTNVKDIIDNNQTIIIYISKGNNNDIPDSDSGKNLEPVPEEDTDSGSESVPVTPTEPEEEDEEEEESEYDDDFYASDKEKVKWHDEANLKIFEDSTNISKIQGKIAPESTGTYKFEVNNGTKYNLKYKITFIETNQYGMNIKYKLKRGNNYIVDHYVSYSDLDISNVLLNTKSSDTYYLEWKWVGDNDSEDTNIGKNANSSNIKYELKINIEAESV